MTFSTQFLVFDTEFLALKNILMSFTHVVYVRAELR